MMGDKIELEEFLKERKKERELKALGETIQKRASRTAATEFLERFSHHYADLGYIPRKIRSMLINIINLELETTASILDSKDEAAATNEFTEAAAIVRGRLWKIEDLS